MVPKTALMLPESCLMVPKPVLAFMGWTTHTTKHSNVGRLRFPVDLGLLLRKSEGPAEHVNFAGEALPIPILLA